MLESLPVISIELKLTFKFFIVGCFACLIHPKSGQFGFGKMISLVVDAGFQVPCDCVIAAH